MCNRNRWAARAIGPSVHLRFTATRAQDNIVLTVAYGGTFDGKAWFSGVTIDEAAGAEPWPAPVRCHDLWPGLSLSRRRMDLPPHRRPALRARLPAWPSDGQGNPAVHGALRGGAGSIGQEQKLESGAHHCQRLFSCEVSIRRFSQEMKGIADGASDAGARWEGRPIDLTDIRGGQHHRRAGRAQAQRCTVTPNGLEGLRLVAPDYVQSQARRGAGSLQRLRRHRTSHARRTHGDRAHHLVAAHARPNRPT